MMIHPSPYLVSKVIKGKVGIATMNRHGQVDILQRNLAVAILHVCIWITFRVGAFVQR